MVGEVVVRFVNEEFDFKGADGAVFELCGQGGVGWVSEWVGRYDVIGEAKTMCERSGGGNLEMLPARALVSGFLVGPAVLVVL